MPGDTAPIRAEEQFDEGRVAAYLRDHLPGLFGDAGVSFAQFPGGKANLTYLAAAGDVEVVLRRPPLGPVAPGSHDMRREHEVLSVLWEVLPEAPRSLHLCEDEEVMGDVFLVMERHTGWVVREQWPGELPDGPEVRRSVGEAAVDLLARLHLVDYEALGLEDLGRPEGFLRRQVEGWVDRWRKARHDEVPAMEEAVRALAESVPEPQRAVLLHNDFKLDNLMLGADADVLALFDWDMATLGDPLVDLGGALAYWAQPGDTLWQLQGAVGISLGDHMPRDDVVARYAAATGLDVSDAAYYHALGLFRVAVIVQQIYIRFLRGQTSDPRFEMLGALVPLLAEEAAALLRSA
jgi:aminoglycoside phosphotransferase (APT) family kinase protein